MKYQQFYVDGIYHKILVKFVMEDSLRVLAKSTVDEDIYGFYDSSTNCIYLNIQQDLEKMKHTFWHEMVHAMDYDLQSVEDEETKADLLGSFLLRLTKGRFIDEFRV